jgi:hypothetical protein
MTFEWEMGAQISFSRMSYLFPLSLVKELAFVERMIGAIWYLCIPKKKSVTFSMVIRN